MNRLYNGAYYFYLESYTYVKSNETSVILLNTLDNQKIISMDQRIVELIKRLSCKKNNVQKIDFDRIYTDDVYQLFFEEVRDKFMGDLIAVHLSNHEPVNFYPIGKIEDNIRKKGSSASLDYNLLCNSVFNLNIYLNTTCTHNCPSCRNYVKQFCCCSKFLTENDCSMDADLIEKIFGLSIFKNLNRINISGGDISQYNNLDRALYYLSDYKENCYAYFKYDNISSINEKIRSFFDNRMIILVDASGIDENDIEIIMNECNQFEIHMIITEEAQLKKIARLTTSSIPYKLIPFYNGENMSFFKDNVFLDEEDILGAEVTIKKIHKNQLMNSYFFGNLMVLPDGRVCIDMNETMLGNLNDEPILDILSKALKNEDSLWFKTRNTTTCSDCLFVDLCPPISNYELATGRFNLCNIKS